MKRFIAKTEALLDLPLLEVKKYGIPRPGKPPLVDEGDRFPSDITKLSNKQVRSLLSYWTAQYAYANYRLARALSRRAMLTRLHERRKSILFEKLKPEKKTSDWSEAIQGRIQKDERMAYLTEELAKAEGMVELLNPLVWDFKAYADVASREITARGHEMELTGRSGMRTRRD